MSAFPKSHGVCEVYKKENVSQECRERGRLFEGVATGNIYSLLRAMYVILGIVIRMLELLCAASRCEVVFILRSHTWGSIIWVFFKGMRTHRQRSYPYLIVNYQSLPSLSPPILISKSRSTTIKDPPLRSFSPLLLLLWRSECPQIHIFHFIARGQDMNDLKKSLFPKPTCETRRKVFKFARTWRLRQDPASNRVRSKVTEDFQFDFLAKRRMIMIDQERPSRRERYNPNWADGRFPCASVLEKKLGEQADKDDTIELAKDLNLCH